MRGPLPFAAVLLCALAAPAAPQQATQPAPAPAEQTFFEVIDVRVVNVEVVVTDREGKPVPGLAREDFELLENGRPVEINYFHAESAAAADATPAPAGE